MSDRMIDWLFRSIGVLVLVAAILTAVLNRLKCVDLSANLSTELGSIAITVLVIDELNKYRATQQEKRRLILQMGSPNNEFAIEAVRILRSEGWLKKEVVRNAFLIRANLHKANLNGADLRGAILVEANLHGASLRFANLESASLDNADLSGANLIGANLKGARLVETKLRGAVVNKADFRGANLYKAVPISVDFQDAILNEGTVLPDGTKYVPGTKVGPFLPFG